MPTPAQILGPDLQSILARLPSLFQQLEAADVPERYDELEVIYRGLLASIERILPQLEQRVELIQAERDFLQGPEVEEVEPEVLPFRNSIIADLDAEERELAALIAPARVALAAPLPPRPTGLRDVAVPVEIPREGFSIGDILDPAFWEGLFSDAAASRFLLEETQPALIREVWGSLLDFDQTIYRGVLNLPAELIPELDDLFSTKAEWIRDEGERVVRGIVGGAQDLVGAALEDLTKLFTPGGITDLLEQVIDPLASVFTTGLTLFLDSLEVLAGPVLGPFLRPIRVAWEGLPDDAKRVLDLENPESAAIALLAGAALGGIAGALITGPIRAWAAPVQWRANTAFRPELLTIDDLLALRFRSAEDESAVREELGNVGMSQVRFNLLRSARRPLPGIDQVRDARFRDAIDDAEVTRQLSIRGFFENDIDLIRSTFEVFPSVTDVVRFGVREVYKENIVIDFQLDQDFPDDAIPDAARVGLKVAEFRKFWRAHWELPSIDQAFRMHHRTTTSPIAGFSEALSLSDGSTVHRVVSLERLNELLRVGDVMARWRDPLTRIAFTPFTRVDIRRLFRTGVFTLAQVERAYLDIGYTQENALIQADFVVGLERERTFDELETILGGQAVDGTIEVGDALSELTAIAVPERVQEGAERRIRARVDRARSLDLVSAWRSALRAARIDVGAFTRALSELQVPVATVDHLIRVEEVRAGLDQLVFEAPEIRASGRTSPIRRFREGLTTVPEFRSEMAALGYRPDQVDRFEFIAALDLDTNLRLDTLSAYRSGLRTGRLEEREFRELLAELGINEALVEVYIQQDQLRRKLEDPTQEDTELRASGRGIAITRYREGWTVGPEFALEMASLGYTNREIDLYRVHADLAFDTDWKEDIRLQLGEQFVRGVIAASEYISRLVTLGMREDRATTHLARLQATLLPRVQVLPAVEPQARYLTATGKAERQLAILEFRSDAITVDQLTDRLRGLEMSEDLVVAVVELEEFRQSERVELPEVAPVPEFETDAGKIRLRTLREAFRGDLLNADQYRGQLVELQVPPESVEAIVEFEVTRLASRRRVEPVTPIPDYLTPAGRSRSRLALEQFRAQAIDRTVLVDALRDLGTPEELIQAKADLEEFRLESRTAVPEVTTIPFWQTDEGKLRVRTVREAFKGLFITDAELRAALVALEVPANIADAITSLEVTRLARR